MKRPTLLLASVVLSSCTLVRIPHHRDASFERLTINYEYGHHVENRDAVTAPTVAVKGNEDVTCGLYKPPKYPSSPPLPEITELDASDATRVNDILGDYINALRDYIRQRSRAEDQALQDYRKSCKGSDPDKPTVIATPPPPSTIP